ncbi:hypothetical protein NDU88_002072 [Pleurodeles waltl]|uniref:Uncharacterized protein n=1 Tax=Pleurodeles waltl TaxID=8319 RepID=A0AAV7W1Z2_PLEWA|nr:hypothetical protein NDU88_002072 [Pleurodeles waltl]
MARWLQNLLLVVQQGSRRSSRKRDVEELSSDTGGAGVALAEPEAVEHFFPMSDQLELSKEEEKDLGEGSRDLIEEFCKLALLTSKVVQPRQVLPCRMMRR